LKFVLVGDEKGQNPRIFVFAVQATFLPVSTLKNRLKVTEQVFLGALQHPTKFQAKILTGKYFS